MRILCQEKPLARIFEHVEENNRWGANNATEGEIPFQVQIVVGTIPICDWFVCGGSLVRDDLVLTAAHCVIDRGIGEIVKPNNITVRLGSPLGCKYEQKHNKKFGKHVRAKEVRVHPTYLAYQKLNLPAIAKSITSQKYGT